MALAGWSTTAASNSSVGGINWTEGQFASTVNNSAREMMADVAKVADGTDIATGWHVKANGFGLHDQTDTTKKVIFDTSAVSTGTTRTIAFPNTAGTLALTSQLTTDAPTDATYVVASPNGTLSAERVLTAGAGITVTDSSTAGTITIASAAAAWSAYTPTVTAASGSLTSVSATGSYSTNGKTLTFRITITLTTNGTGATSLAATLPSAAAAVKHAPAGLQTTDGLALACVINASASVVTFLKYDGTYPGASGKEYVVSGTYETA